MYILLHYIYDTHTYIRTYVRTYIHTYIHTYIYTYVYIYMYMYVYIYIHSISIYYNVTLLPLEHYKKKPRHILV